MILFKIFGFFDFLALIVMILLVNSLVSWRIGMMFAAYLILKGFIFKGDFASTIDLVVGVYIALIPVFSWKLLTIIFAIYLGQKAFISWL